MSGPSVPLAEFILKVHSRCDLACDHCYVYEAADQSWRGRPAAIPDEVISRTAQRIAEHAVAHGLSAVRVILHGGEPLLAGLSRLRRVITELAAALRPVCHLDLRVHTNGVLLSTALCELFAEHEVRVGVSLDGDRAANDRHRRYADGRSSYDKVVRAIGLLRSERFRHLYAGLLCTIDIANDPLVVYESLMRLEPPRIDFLLPHATWDQPPARTPGVAAEYADWLITIFDRWSAEGQPVPIRTFDSVISSLRGGPSFTESLGLEAAAHIVVETDGSYEQVDSLKVAFDGAPATGMNVFDHDVGMVAKHAGVLARQQGAAGLCQTCRECPVVSSCGGGLYPHRYRAGSFGNTSVFCEDLLKLISHVRGSLAGDSLAGWHLRAHALDRTHLRALAAGAGDAAAMASLMSAQRSLLRALLTVVYREGTTAAAVPRSAKERLRSAWSILGTIDREQPDAVDTVLRHPYVRAWAVECLARLRAPAGQDRAAATLGLETPGLDDILGHLGAVAAAAALRAGTPVAVTVPIIGGAVCLPTLGRLMAGPGGPEQPAGEGPDTADIALAGGTVTIQAGRNRWAMPAASLLSGEACPVRPAGGGLHARWEPLRALSAPGIRVTLEDTDPFRDCHQGRVAPRLTDEQFASWQRQFQAAWQEIGRAHALYAPALRAGLVTVVPLATAGPGQATGPGRTVFGSVGIVLTADPVTLALSLIREFQYVKLRAVLDLYDLYEPTDHRLFPGPPEDMHPLEGLLEGAYAHLAVADFWRSRQRAAGPAGELADQGFALWQDRACHAIDTLAHSGSLTQLGTWFVGEMRHSVCP